MRQEVQTKYRGSRVAATDGPPPTFALRATVGKQGGHYVTGPAEAGHHVHVRSDRERRWLAEPANVEPRECRFVSGNVITNYPGSARLA